MGDSHVDWGFIWKIALSFISVLALIVAFFVRDWMQSFSHWRKESEQRGGFVTREQYFNWANEGIAEIDNWRDAMLEKGGALTVQAHEKICEKKNAETRELFSEKIDQSIRHFNELIKKDFDILKRDLTIEMLKVNDTVKQMVKEIKRHNGEV